MSKLLIFVIVIALIIISFPAAVFAQTPTSGTPAIAGNIEGSLGVARMIETSEKNLADGTILSAGASQQGAVRTNIPYDSQVLGVVARNAAIILDNTSGSKNGVPVISNGTVYVLVSTTTGKIKKGDLITSSLIPGVAQKATKDGYVLGSALEDYSESDTKKVASIAASLDLHYFNSKPTFPGTLSDIFKLVVIPTKEGPSALFKYLMAALVTLGSLVLGFMSFGRAASKGVEALGRNPAASKIIHLGIIFNVAIVVAIALAGLGVSFLILRL